MKKSRLLILFILATLVAFSLVSISNAQQSHMTEARENYVSIGCWSAPPRISWAFPAFGISGCSAVFFVHGSGFQDGARVELVRGDTAIEASKTWVICPSCIKCIFSLHGAAPGWWDIRVINPDGGSATLERGFLVIGCPPCKTHEAPETPQATVPENETPADTPVSPDPDRPKERLHEGDSGSLPGSQIPDGLNNDGMVSDGEDVPDPPRIKENDKLDFQPLSGRVGDFMDYVISGSTFMPNIVVVLRKGDRVLMSTGGVVSERGFEGCLHLGGVSPGKWEISLRYPDGTLIPLNIDFIVHKE